MLQEHEGFCYHGRRSVDELISAINAESATVARIHQELSQLHLDRFVATMKAAMETATGTPA